MVKRSSQLLFTVLLERRRPDQCVAILGSSPELGSWDPQRCIKLTTTTIPDQGWMAMVRVPEGITLRYNYVVLGEHDQLCGAELCQARELVTSGNVLLVDDGPLGMMGKDPSLLNPLLGNAVASIQPDRRSSHSRGVLKRDSMLAHEALEKERLEFATTVKSPGLATAEAPQSRLTYAVQSADRPRLVGLKERASPLSTAHTQAPIALANLNRAGPSSKPGNGKENTEVPAARAVAASSQARPLRPVSPQGSAIAITQVRSISNPRVRPNSSERSERRSDERRPSPSPSPSSVPSVTSSASAEASKRLPTAANVGNEPMRPSRGRKQTEEELEMRAEVGDEARWFEPERAARRQERLLNLLLHEDEHIWMDKLQMDKLLLTHGADTWRRMIDLVHVTKNENLRAEQLAQSLTELKESNKRLEEQRRKEVAELQRRLQASEHKSASVRQAGEKLAAAEKTTAACEAADKVKLEKKRQATQERRIAELEVALTAKEAEHAIAQQQLKLLGDAANAKEARPNGVNHSELSQLITAQNAQIKSRMDELSIQNRSAFEVLLGLRSQFEAVYGGESRPDPVE